MNEIYWAYLLNYSLYKYYYYYNLYPLYLFITIKSFKQPLLPRSVWSARMASKEAKQYFVDKPKKIKIY